jgi:mono/diheme cytochrome c family protein
MTNVSHRSLRWLFTPLIVLLFAAGLVAIVAPHAYAQEDPPFDPDKIPPPASPPSARAGGGIFAQDCAPCHGPTGQSDGQVVPDLPAPPPPFADPETTWARIPAEAFHIAKFGRSDALMPAWGNTLPDEHIWQVLAFAWSLHTDAETVDAGGTLYAESCVACHGEQGAGDGPDASGDMLDFSDSGTMIQVSDADLSQGWDAAHADLGADWDSETRRAVLDYIRTFTYIPPWVSPYQAGEGVIEGQITQGTAGGEQPGGNAVRLYAYLDFSQVANFETTADEEGAFRFENLSTNGDIDYILEADYTDIPYNSAFFKLTDEEPTQTIELIVYDVSDDDSQIVISRGNLLIDHRPGALGMAQVLAFSNRSDKTFTGKTVEGADEPVTLAIKVPPGATNFQFPDGALGDRYLQVGHTIYDTAPMPPGEEMRQLFVSYELPYDGDSVSFTQEWAYPAEEMNMLVAELPGMEINADPLAYQSNDTLQGVEFQLWTGGSFAAGEGLTVELSGVLAAGDVDPRSLTTAHPEGEGEANAGLPTPNTAVMDIKAPLIVGILAAIALVVVAFLGWRRTQGTSGDELAHERNELVRQIAELDDRHASGELTTPQWSNERARLKSRLIEVTQAEG